VCWSLDYFYYSTNYILYMIFRQVSCFHKKKRIPKIFWYYAFISKKKFPGKLLSPNIYLFWCLFLENQSDMLLTVCKTIGFVLKSAVRLLITFLLFFLEKGVKKKEYQLLHTATNRPDIMIPILLWIQRNAISYWTLRLGYLIIICVHFD
jgi:hypothetical protein